MTFIRSQRVTLWLAVHVKDSGSVSCRGMGGGLVGQHVGVTCLRAYGLLRFFPSTTIRLSPIMKAFLYDAPLRLVQLMITTAKLDSRKRLLLVITDRKGYTAVHYAAHCVTRQSDPAVLELLLHEYPQALCATTRSCCTPQQLATL